MIGPQLFTYLFHTQMFYAVFFMPLFLGTSYIHLVFQWDLNLKCQCSKINKIKWNFDMFNLNTKINFKNECRSSTKQCNVLLFFFFIFFLFFFYFLYILHISTMWICKLTSSVLRNKLITNKSSNESNKVA